MHGASCSPIVAVLLFQKSTEHAGNVAFGCPMISQIEATVTVHLARIKTWEADHHAEGWLQPGAKPGATRVMGPRHRSAQKVGLLVLRSVTMKALRMKEGPSSFVPDGGPTTNLPTESGLMGHTARCRGAHSHRLGSRGSRPSPQILRHLHDCQRPVVTVTVIFCIEKSVRAISDLWQRICACTLPNRKDERLYEVRQAYAAGLLQCSPK